MHGFMAPMAAAEMVRGAAQHIPDSAAGAEALLPALGWIEFSVDRNLPAALDAFARSAHLPHGSWITKVRLTFLLSRHRFDEAIALLRDAMRLDPYSAWLQARLAWALHLNGERDASMEQANKALTQWPEHDGVCMFGAMILAYNEEAIRAVAVAEKLVARSPHLDLAMAVHAYAQARAGLIEEALMQLERLQWLSHERFVLNAFTAAVHAALGEVDGALDELRLANENRCPWFFQMLADPRLDAIKKRAQYKKLLGELKAMEAGAEKGEPQWAAAAGQDAGSVAGLETAPGQDDRAEAGAQPAPGKKLPVRSSDAYQSQVVRRLESKAGD
jgi:tetratricopeptide (TPR) repeat protein